MESADHAQIWRSTMPIVMSRFVDGLLMSQLHCHSIFGHADVRVYSDVRGLLIILSRPLTTRPYTEKREALAWMSQCADLCSCNTQNHRRRFRPSFIVTCSLAFAIIVSSQAGAGVMHGHERDSNTRTRDTLWGHGLHVCDR